MVDAQPDIAFIPPERTEQLGVGHIHRTDECRFKIRLLQPVQQIIVFFRNRIRTHHPCPAPGLQQRTAQRVARTERITVGILMGQDQNVICLKQQPCRLGGRDSLTHGD